MIFDPPDIATKVVCALAGIESANRAKNIQEFRRDFLMYKRHHGALCLSKKKWLDNAVLALTLNVMSIQRLVVKAGTQTLLGANGEISADRISALTSLISQLKQTGFDIALVSSGAIGLGQKRLSLKAPLNLAEKQASASVGQSLLMQQYESALDKHKLICGQLLLTSRDLSDRESFVNLKETFETLLRYNVVPIVNENDCISTAEIRETQQASFGDNDKLSSIVAAKIGADLLILLTDVPGVYTENPKHNSSAKHIPILRSPAEARQIQVQGKSTLGRGGMSVKIDAAFAASICGVHVLITSFDRLNEVKTLKPDSNPEILSQMGTWIPANAKLKGKKKWIGTSSGYKGVVVINEGARKALLERNASLLSVGIINITGEFESGDVVSIKDEAGSELGRGVARMGPECKEGDKIFIHRDQMALFVEAT